MAEIANKQNGGIVGGNGSTGYTDTSVTDKNVAIPLDAKYLWVQVNGNDTSGGRKPSKVEFIDNI